MGNMRLQESLHACKGGQLPRGELQFLQELLAINEEAFESLV